MIQKKKIVGVIGTVAGLVLGFGIITYAADSYEIKSQGKIVFNNDTEETADDVVFDAADLVTLHDMVKTGKSNLSSVLNTYPNTEVASIDTFENLTTAVDTLTAVPDIYYYDKATEGADCIRYILIDGAYYPCDQYGNKTSETALSGTITVVTKDDTTEPSEGEIRLVKYEQIGAENLSAGFAGYANKSFILGSGADNISYRNSAKATLIQLSDTENKSFSIDIKEVCNDNNIDYTSLTKDNFLLNISSYSASIAATDFTGYGNGGHLPWGTYGGSSVITKTYDPATGIFTCNIPENWYTNTSGPWNLAAPGENFAYYYHYAKVVSSAKVIPYLVVY